MRAVIRVEGVRFVLGGLRPISYPPTGRPPAHTPIRPSTHPPIRPSAHPPCTDRPSALCFLSRRESAKRTLHDALGNRQSPFGRRRRRSARLGRPRPHSATFAPPPPQHPNTPSHLTHRSAPHFSRHCAFDPCACVARSPLAPLLIQLVAPPPPPPPPPTTHPHSVHLRPFDHFRLRPSSSVAVSCAKARQRRLLASSSPVT